MKKSKFLLALFLWGSSLLNAQNRATKPDNERWQQRVNYYMEIDMDVETNRYQG